jgi:acetate kinase
MEPVKRVLSLNCGSSSLKFGIFEVRGNAVELLFEGEAEEMGAESSTFWTKVAGKEKKEAKTPLKNQEDALKAALKALADAGLDEVDAIGHRVVHGGPKVRAHVKLDDAVLRQLRDAVDFAPLHLPASLAVIDAISKLKPGTPQVICLDTAFHRDIPAVAATFALPKEVRSMGVERFGFHGLSLESILHQFEQIPERLVVAHLGNGSSITAIAGGKSIDTSMGMTPTGGVMMGSRTGDLDPGVLIYLMRHGYAEAARMEQLVDRQSGLKGVSELSSDVRELSGQRSTNEKADLALRMFEYQVRKTIAGMIAALKGLDVLVFTGGIGEHDDGLRQRITSSLTFCGQFEMKVLPAEEDLQIARITAGVLYGAE